LIDANKTIFCLICQGVFLGMMFGSLTFGIIADKYGRRRVIVISAILNTVFGIFTAFAPNYYWVLIARILVGFALSGAQQG
jgi:putative MFS transporter